MMLSELEYLYFDPGRKLSGWSATNDRRSTGAGGVSSDALNAFANPSVWLKSGMPLLCWSSCQSFTFAHAFGRSGRTLPIVLVSFRWPDATADSAAAPLNAL